jgi:hypothetical protein
MHYRIRGTNVQLVKTRRDESSGKAVSKPIGSANLLTGEINEKASEALTAEERKEVESWISRHQSIQRQKQELEFRTLPESLSRVASWVAEANPAVLSEHAAEVTEALKHLRKALDNRIEGKERPKMADRAEKKAERKRAKQSAAA